MNCCAPNSAPCQLCCTPVAGVRKTARAIYLLRGRCVVCGGPVSGARKARSARHRTCTFCRRAYASMQQPRQSMTTH